MGQLLLPTLCRQLFEDGLEGPRLVGVVSVLPNHGNVSSPRAEACMSDQESVGMCVSVSDQESVVMECDE